MKFSYNAKVSGLLFLLSLIAGTTASFGQSQYWTPPSWQEINAETRGNFSSQPEPIRMIAPRNGYAIGQIVLRGGRVDTARMGDFQGPGNANIPAALTQVRFAAKSSPGFPEVSHDNFDILLEEPLSSNLGSNAMQPVWIRVQVPPSARPGTYQSSLRIGAANVPVVLEVADYLLPDPKDWVAWKHMTLVYESTAWSYGHSLWSEDHFQKMIPSLRKLGALGNNVVHIPLQRETFLGNDHGMLVFRQEGGSLRPDFRFVDKFLDLYEEHVGEPRVLWLYVWELRQGDSNIQQDDREVRISIVSGSGNTLRDGTLPLFGSGGASDAAWDQMITGMRQRMQARGWDPSTLMIGSLADQRDRPGASAIRFFAERNVPWVVFSHWRGDPTHANRPLNLSISGADAPVGLAEMPYPSLPGSSPERLGGGWKEEYVVPWLTSIRGAPRDNAPPVIFRLAADASVSDQTGYNTIGLGRVGLDGWRSTRPGSGSAQTPIIHIRRNGWFRLWRQNASSILAPGPNGAIPTVRFENLRAGAQEAEARILLERALESGSLSSSLRNEIEEFLPKWISQRFYIGGSRNMSPENPQNWHELIVRLYDLAGRAARDADLVAEVDGAADAVQLFREENARQWTSADGRSIEAELVRYDQQGVTLLLANNQTATLPLDRLSSGDREFIREQSGFRIWTSRDGRELEARMLALEGNQLTIERLDGMEFQVDISNLSDADQRWARSQ